MYKFSSIYSLFHPSGDFALNFLRICYILLRAAVLNKVDVFRKSIKTFNYSSSLSFDFLWLAWVDFRFVFFWNLNFLISPKLRVLSIHSWYSGYTEINNLNTWFLWPLLSNYFAVLQNYIRFTTWFTFILLKAIHYQHTHLPIPCAR